MTRFTSLLLAVATVVGFATPSQAHDWHHGNRTGARGVAPRSKRSMTIMRAPQRGQGRARLGSSPGSYWPIPHDRHSATAASAGRFAQGAPERG